MLTFADDRMLVAMFVQMMMDVMLHAEGGCSAIASCCVVLNAVSDVHAVLSWMRVRCLCHVMLCRVWVRC
jgi:hypothetical protein